MLGYRVYMIDALLRRPSSSGEFFADSARLACFFSLVGVVLWYGPVDVAVFLLVLMGALVSRCLELSRVFDGVYCLILLAAAWSSVLDLYARIGWWDLPVHFAATGVIAVVAFYLLVRAGAVAHPGAARPVAARPGRPAPSSAVLRAAVPVLVLSLGLAVSVLWELGEWVGHTFVDENINVGYQDTLGDLAAGGLGALLAGFLLLVCTRGTADAAASPGLLRLRPRRLNQ